MACGASVRTGPLSLASELIQRPFFRWYMPKRKPSAALTHNERRERIKHYQTILAGLDSLIRYGGGDDEVIDDVRDLERWINVLRGVTDGMPRIKPMVA